MNWLWYIAGVLTLPVGTIIYGIVNWAFSKTAGSGGCLLDWCNHPRSEIGEHFNITVWARGLRHRFLTSRRHKREVLDYWRKRRDEGMSVHPKARKKLK